LLEQIQAFGSFHSAFDETDAALLQYE